MAITYNKISERTEQWGIDVTVQFFSDGKYSGTVTFKFNDQKQIDSDFESRMEKACINIQNMIDEQEVLKVEMTDELKKHFEVNDSLTKEDYLVLESTGKIPIGVVSK